MAAESNLAASKLAQRLLAETFLQNVDHRAELVSTNDLALELAANRELPIPALVVCDRQTGGRGRGTNRWWSSAESLAFSLIVDLPDGVDSERGLLISPLTALAIGDALAMYHSADPFQIKWPNDVFVCERKICGILIESAPRNTRRLVIGCGVNVNQPLGCVIAEAGQTLQTAEDLRMAIALVDLIGRPVELAELLKNVIQCFESRWLGLSAEAGEPAETGELLEAIRQRCFLTGRTVVVRQSERLIRGECLGIDQRGALRVYAPPQEVALISGTVESYSEASESI